MAQGKEFTKEEKEQAIQSLQDYLELGFSRNRACKVTGLAPQTLSNWVKEDETLGMRLSSWENVVNVMALKNIKESIKINEDIDDSWNWAKRKMKKEFSERQEVTDGEGNPVPLLNALYVQDNISNKEDSETNEEG